MSFNKTNMLKIASTLSECLTKPIDLILSHTGINLRENASTFLVKTNLSYITKAFFNNIKKKKDKNNSDPSVDFVQYLGQVPPQVKPVNLLKSAIMLLISSLMKCFIPFITIFTPQTGDLASSVV